MKNFFKRVAVALCITLLAPTMFQFIPSVKAASKADMEGMASQLVTRNGETGVCSSPESIKIKNGVKYIYTSSNKAVATVDEDGNINGLKKGKATITVKEVYGGKTSTVGTYTISVVGAKLDVEEMTMPVMRSFNPHIFRRNFKAKYTYEPVDTTIVTVNENNDMVGLKEGETKVKVFETYKGKTTGLGTFAVHIRKAEFSPATINLGINCSTPAGYGVWMEGVYDDQCSYESSNSSVVAIKNTVDEYGVYKSVMSGIAYGDAQITVYKTVEGVRTVVGTYQVKVKDIPVTSFEVPKWKNSKDGVNSISLKAGAGYYLRNDFKILPRNTSTPITYSSSNEKVASVDKYGLINAKSEGTAEVKATCGSFTVKLNVNVTK